MHADSPGADKAQLTRTKAVEGEVEGEVGGLYLLPIGPEVNRCTKRLPLEGEERQEEAEAATVRMATPIAGVHKGTSLMIDATSAAVWVTGAITARRGVAMAGEDHDNIATMHV